VQKRKKERKKKEEFWAEEKNKIAEDH